MRGLDLKEELKTIIPIKNNCPHFNKNYKSFLQDLEKLSHSTEIRALNVIYLKGSYRNKIDQMMKSGLMWRDKLNRDW